MDEEVAVDIEANGVEDPSPIMGRLSGSKMAFTKDVSANPKRILEFKKKQLEEELKNVNEAIAMLDKNPGVNELFTALAKAGIRGGY